MILNLLAAFTCCLSEKRKGRLLLIVLPLTALTIISAVCLRMGFGGVWILSIPGSALVGLSLVRLWDMISKLEGVFQKAGAALLLLICLGLGLDLMQIPWAVLFTVLAFLLRKKAWESLERAGQKVAERIDGIAAGLEGAIGGLIRKAGSLLEDEEEVSEDDFMNSKKGKLVMAVCILMVIYMIASGFAIYKLNAKINSVYEITQEMK